MRYLIDVFIWNTAIVVRVIIFIYLVKYVTFGARLSGFLPPTQSAAGVTSTPICRSLQLEWMKGSFTADLILNQHAVQEGKIIKYTIFCYLVDHFELTKLRSDFVARHFVKLIEKSPLIQNVVNT